MTIGPAPTRFTPDDLLRMDEEGGCLYELVEGRLVEKAMSSLANRTAGIITTRLNNYCDRAKSGDVVYPEQSFQCFPHDSSLIRRPDIAVIVSSRMKLVPDEGHVPIAPDLAIEVISLGDRVYDLEEKLSDYRKAGVKLVWEVNPKFRFIRVHYLDRSPERLEQSDTLHGDPVLPGFSTIVSDFLPPRP